ncbi:MAG: hypothetical protein ACE5HO_01690 [bacterium]
MLKYLMLLAAGFTTIFAILIGGHSLLVDYEGPFLWIATKVLICLFVVGTGVFSWLNSQSKMTGFTSDWLLLVGAMGLMVIGAAGAVWTFHMGVVTGDFEYWIVMVDLALVAQGGLTILHLWNRRPNSVHA